MTKNQIRVLLVEDNPADVLFLREAVAQDALAVFHLTVVESLAEALASLGGQQFDAVLLDLGLHDSQGLPTFLKLHQIVPELPVVVLSALDDENIALQALQAGAQDYLVKRPQEFPVAGRAVRYAIERQRSQAALHQSEEQYRSLLASLESVVACVDANGRFLYVNGMAAQHMGAPAEALVGKTMAEVFPKPVASSQLAHVRQVIREDRALVNEAPTLVQGQLRWYRTAIQPVHDPTGRVAYALINATDIHNLKMAEAALLQQLEVQRVVAEIAQSFVNIDLSNRGAIIQNALASLGKQVGVDRCYFLTYYPKEDAFTITDEWCIEGLAPSGQTGQRYRTQDYPLLFQSILRGEVLNVPRVADLPLDEAGVAILKAQGVASTLALPLTGEQGILGLIGFDAVIQEHAWQAAEINLLRIVGRIIINGLEQLQYEQEVLDLNQSLEQRVHERTEALRQSQTSLQAVLDTASDLIQSLDETGHFVFVNQAWTNTLGYTAEEARHLSMLHVIDPAYHAYCQCVVQELLSTGTPQTLEVIFRTRNGRSVILEGRINVRQELDGRCLTNGFFRDITPRREAETALEKRNLQLRTLFNALPDLIVRFRPDGSVLDYNLPAHLEPAALPTFLPTLQAKLRDHPTSEQAVDNWLKQALDTPHQLYTHHLQFMVDGAVRVFEARLVAGDTEQVICVLRDMTESERAGETLRRANIEMERALRMKDEFLANMSHELRTPLQGILGMCELMLDQIRGPLNEHQQKSLRLIESSGQHLLDLINDLLDLSKIEAGKMELHFEEILIDDICQASLQFVREIALKKKIKVGFANALTGERLSADTKRLKQMLVNLLSNAVKFTPEGGRVSLNVSADPHTRCVYFVVQDTGPGIAPAEQARLFQPFAQLDSQLSRQYEGTGLGLALVKRLAEQHGGTVQLTSAGIPGQGSCFTITIPFRLAQPQPLTMTVQPEAAISPSTAICVSGPLLLLVEDNEVNIELVQDYLSHAGYRIVVARTGTEALELANASSPDLILMDVQLPHLDGLEVTRRLRTQAQFATIPIIALTASAMTGDRERCLAAGATDYMSKPLRMKELLHMVRQLTASSRPEQAL